MPLAPVDDNLGSMLLVVDTTILTAASPERIDEHIDASKARSVLEAIRTICHRVVLSAEARSEWDRNSSRFGRTWWIAMANRGKIKNVDLYLDQHIETIKTSGLAIERHEGLIKDLHLVVAALEHGGHVVISDDKRAAKGFSDLAASVPIFGNVDWWSSDHPIPCRSN